MKNISDNSCRANRNTHFRLRNFFQKYFRLCDNVGTYGRTRQTIDDHIIGRLLFASWITKATNTQLEYEILTAYPLQQRLPDSASILSCTYIAYSVFS
jgi:hypothetical protein